MATFGQTSRIETLKAQYYVASDDGQRLKAAMDVCAESFSLNLDTLHHYALLAKNLSHELRDRHSEVLADTYIETWLGRRALCDSAVHLCDADLKGLTIQADGPIYTRVLMQKAYQLTKGNRHMEALTLAYSLLSEAESSDDTADQIFDKCIIGTVYRDMSQTEPALAWFDRADKTADGSAYEHIKNDFGVFFEKGQMYNWRMDGDLTPADRSADSARSIYYLDRAIQDSRQFENLRILAVSLNVKAAVIGSPEHVKQEGDYVMEARHINDALKDTIGILNSVSPICFYYIDQGTPLKGVEVCKAGIAMVGRGNTYNTMDLYEVLGQCYKSAGDMTSYAQTLEMLVRMRDSVYKINSERALAGMQAKYEDQKKENTIIRQKLDLAARRNSIYAISIVLGMLMVGVVFLVRYFTKRHRKQKQQAALAVTEAEEAERRRISADLHDNIGAYAAAAASTIATINPGDQETERILVKLGDNVQEMITQLNDSIWALNKKEVRMTGIADRFKLFMRKLEHAYPSVQMSFAEEIGDDRLLSPFQALHLFRIMQEALNNALRHSRCTVVTITMVSNAGHMRVSIQDNGVGMTDVSRRGNGINNLKARARESGWQAEWVNAGAKGTTVVVTAHT
jgi:signal transduction histidine kinase